MQILDAALGASWAMEESALRQILEVAAREHEITPEALEAYRAKTLDNAERATTRDGVAILGVSGPLFKRANLMTSFCGATSYETLMRDFTVALDDPAVRAILLNIDSPGGETAGAAELAQAIFEARGKKPIVAYAGDLMASAAYWIGSAADTIVVGKSAIVGSIGVRATLTSARDPAGVRRFDFVSSQSPYKISDPATDDGAARIQARVDALASIFVDSVAQHRDVTSAQVLDAFGKGDCLIGVAALAAGMVDSIGTFESILEQRALATRQFADLTARLTSDGDTARTTAATAERERVASILAASIAGHEAERDAAIASGASAADFKSTIVEKEFAKIKARVAAVDKDLASNARVPAAPAASAEMSEDEKAAALLIAAGRGFAKK